MKKIIFGFYFLVLALTSHAQYFEAGLLVGGSNYMGDLSNNSSKVYFSETRGAVGVFGRYNLMDMLTLRASFNFGTIAGADANSDNESIRRRNLSFKSNLYEFGLTAEINLPGFQPYALSKPFSPFLFGGVALTSFNPKANYNGEWYELQPLGTEGQGIPNFESPYSKTALSFPFGLGFKYAVNDTWNVGLECGARFSMSDYLDDAGGLYADYGILQGGNGDIAAALGNRTGEYLGTEPVNFPAGTKRGDNKNNDWYFIAGLTVSYNFMDNGLVGSRGRSKRKSGCRTD